MPTADSLSKFNVPQNFESILSLLSTYYQQENKPLLQKIIVNSKYKIEVNIESTGDRFLPEFGHAVYFQVPRVLYQEILLDRQMMGNTLQGDLNTIMRGSSFYEEEYIARVYLDLLSSDEIVNWRNESGLLIQNSILSTAKNEGESNRIWGNTGFFKLFLSHKSENKLLATQLKDSLSGYGISGFVAHEDIEPTREWQDEIEKALTTADALAPLLVEGFSQSKWTDQEIGIAIGRGAVIVPIKFDLDPYGFIGKYQAVPCKSFIPGKESETANRLASQIFELMFRNEITRERVIAGIVTKFEASKSFAETNSLMQHMYNIEKLPTPLIDRLEKAHQENFQVKEAIKADYLPALINKWRQNNQR